MQNNKANIGWFLISEYLAGVLATVITLLAYYLSFNITHNLMTDYYKIFFIPIFYIFIKLVSGYYLSLYLYLKITRTRYAPHKQSLIIIASIAMLAILAILAITSHQSLQAWLSKVTRLSEMFFSPQKPWSLFVYAAFLTSILSPYFFTKLIRR